MEMHTPCVGARLRPQQEPLLPPAIALRRKRIQHPDRIESCPGGGKGYSIRTEMRAARVMVKDTAFRQNRELFG